MNLSVDKIIDQLTMSPHPEGGYFVETWRSREICELPGLGKRNLGTGIYFLMPHGHVSRFHRLSADELWHFYQGDPITVVMLDKKTGISKHLVGPIGSSDAKPQLIIPKGAWFGAIHQSEPHFGYTLVGCTVSPGFEFADFELASGDNLIKQFPEGNAEIQNWIRRLT